MKDLLGFGTPFLDYIVHIDHLPTKPDEGAQLQQTSWQGGGNVASALAVFGQLGRESSMSGVVGADKYGDFLIKDFSRFNVDSSHMIRDGENAFSIILVDPVTKGRNILVRRGTGREFTLEDIDENFVKQHKILHLEHLDEVTCRMADIIHENGGLVAIDAGYFHPESHALISHVDIFIGSEFYYNNLFGKSDELEKNLAYVRSLGPKIVVFTFGGRGSAVLWDGGYKFCPGYSIEVFDTLGAGDVYHGAYLFAFCEGMDPAQCAQFANAVAAIKCTGIGGRASTPNYEMTKQFMKTGTFDRTLIEQKTAFYSTFNMN